MNLYVSLQLLMKYRTAVLFLHQNKQVIKLNCIIPIYFFKTTINQTRNISKQSHHTGFRSCLVLSNAHNIFHMFFLLSINDHTQHYTSSLKLRCFMRRHVAHLIKGGKIKSETFKTAAPKPLFFILFIVKTIKNTADISKNGYWCYWSFFYSIMSQLFCNNSLVQSVIRVKTSHHF